METKRTPSPPPPDEHRPNDEGREIVERAERAWARQVELEEAAPRRGLPSFGPRLRWLLLALAIAMIVFLLFDRLGRIG